MKKILMVILTVNCLLFLKAQNVGINNAGAAPHSSAMLDINSTTKGMLTPRMTSTQRAAIVSPAEGLIVYDTNTKSFWYYNNSIWNEIPKGNFSLPYAGATASLTKVFSIGNTNTSVGSVAIYGLNSNIGSGYGINNTAGVWGDNSDGYGIYGTSNNGNGVYGISSQNHGIFGTSGNSQSAGVYGAHFSNGTGVLGLVISGGVGVHGQAHGTSGKAAVFEITDDSNTDTLMKLVYKGIGNGLVMDFSNSANTNHAISVFNQGYGSAIHAKSNKGVTALFESDNNGSSGNEVVQIIQNGFTGSLLKLHHNNTNNLNEAAFIHNSGKGNSLKLFTDNQSNNMYMMSAWQMGTGGGIDLSLINSSATGHGIKVVNNGYGDGVLIKANYGTGINSSVSALTGKAAIFENSNTGNYDTLMKLTHKGGGRGIVLDLANTSNLQDALTVINKGSGSAIYAKSEKGTSAFFENTNSSNTSVLTRFIHNGSMGNTINLHHQNINNTNTAVSFMNSGNGSALSLLTDNALNNKYLLTGINTGIGGGIELSLNNINATGDGINIVNNGTGSAIDAKNITGTTIYGLNSGASGRAIRGSATGTDGVAIYGEAGNSASLSYAGYFRNANGLNTRNVVQIDNLGTGNFLTLTNGLGDTKTSIAKSGNITTDGTLTVKSNNGIVRNSGSAQMRYEVASAVFEGPGGTEISLGNFESALRTVNFSTAFSSPPAVSVANITSSSGSFTINLNVEVLSVTTTGCTVKVRDSQGDPISFKATWKLIIIGPE